MEIRGDGRRRRPGDHMSLALDDQEGTGSPAALIESGLSACAANCEKDGGTTSSNPLSSSGESANHRFLSCGPAQWEPIAMLRTDSSKPIHRGDLSCVPQMPHQGLSLSVDAFTDLESPTTVTEMISSYLDRPILSLAVTLPMLLQNVEAELANEVPRGSNCPARRLPSASR